MMLTEKELEARHASVVLRYAACGILLMNLIITGFVLWKGWWREGESCFCFMISCVIGVGVSSLMFGQARANKGRSSNFCRACGEKIK